MRRIIENYKGEKKEMECIGCACAETGESTPGFVYHSDLFQVHQDQEIPVAGFVILATNRHIRSIDEMTAEEAQEFTELTRLVRKGMREVLGINQVYLIQEENSEDHFHLWFFPVHEWMKDPKWGRKSTSCRPLMKYARENMKTLEIIASVEEAAQKLRNYLAN